MSESQSKRRRAVVADTGRGSYTWLGSYRVYELTALLSEETAAH